jgi:hypothetical protein
VVRTSAYSSTPVFFLEKMVSALLYSSTPASRWLIHPLGTLNNVRFDVMYLSYRWISSVAVLEKVLQGLKVVIGYTDRY